MQKKKTKWIKLRHAIIRNLAYCVLYPYSKIKYGITVEKFKQQGNRPYLILYNHQTAFDQFFVGMAFSGPVYYLASEDLFSKGWVSSLIRWLVAPIPIKKQATDVAAVMNCLRVAKEGGTIAIAPEGNRTYSGKTEYMSSAIVGLAKKMKLPIALYRIEGGYGVHPRWSDTVRKGKMRGYVSRVVEPEEYNAMTQEEFYDLVQKELYVDDCEQGGIFKSEKKAEYMERAFYVCPKCGLSEFETKGNFIECKKCGLKAEYGEDLKLRGVDFPFTYTTRWYDYQKDFVNDLDLTKYIEEPLYDEKANLSEVIPYKDKILLKEDARICLYGDKITVNEGESESFNFPFGEISAISVLGKNKLNIYYNDKLYQLKSGKSFNALKYVNFCYRYKNIISGEKDGKFLGL